MNGFQWGRKSRNYDTEYQLGQSSSNIRPSVYYVLIKFYENQSKLHVW